MKKSLFTIAITLLFSFSTLAVFAQNEEEETLTPVPIPKWVSENGYWVAETNINNPSSNILYFYNNEKVLVYKEKVEGVVINIKKRGIRMRLKKVLDQSIVAYEKRKHGAENEMWVINLLKR